MKYHINKNGVPSICRAAKRACPLGGAFSSQNTAERYIQLQSFGEESYNRLGEGDELTAVEATRRGEFVELELEKAYNSGLFTDKLFAEEGVYSRERRELHEKLLDEMMEKYKDVPNDQKVIMSGGLPGAGKTTVLTQYMKLDTNDYATVSSDDFKEMLAREGAVPEIPNLLEMEASTLVHNESSMLADKLASRLAKEGKNVIYDFTAKNYNSSRSRMGLYLANGYPKDNIQLVFVNVTTDVAHTRAKGRYLWGTNNNPKGGRHLPAHVIDACKPTEDWSHSINAEVVKQLYQDGVVTQKPVIYDNSGDSPVSVEFDDFIARIN